MTVGTVEYYECLLKVLAEQILLDCANECDRDKELYSLFRTVEALIAQLYLYAPRTTEGECLYKEKDIAIIKDGLDRLLRNYISLGNCKNC
jgi:hypothetical protein